MVLLPVFNILGRLLMVFSLAYLMPIVCALIFNDGTLRNFLEGAAITFMVGLISFGATWRFHRELKPRDGFLLVSLSWILMSATATTPLLLAYPSMSFTDAFFEAASGLTTTGATVMTDLDHAAPSINLWRHELNWIGGMGIIVFAVAILPMLGVGGMQLYKAETPGPMKDGKLTARIADTARALYLVYCLITVACIVCLKLVGMSWIDAICHAFAAMGLGGFSTRDASVGAFNSVAVEIVLIVFMAIAALNFATHFVAFRERSLRAYWYDSEAKAVIVVLAASCFGVAWYVWQQGVYADYSTALRFVSFNLVSIATDCGFVNTDYGQWPIFAPLWFLFLSCITASSGSTGGGIKMIRTLILVRQSLRELLMLIHPAAVHPIKIGKMAIPDSVGHSVVAFVSLYGMSVLGLTFVLLLSGLDFVSSFSAIIACINNAGPGLNVVGPANNFAALSDFQTWVCSFAMLLGRLEIFSLVIIFTPAFWRK